MSGFCFRLWTLLKYTANHPSCFVARHAYMKNRKPKALDTLSSLGGEILNAMHNVAEESLLRDPNNAKRICSLGTKYVGLLDLELEQEDKDFLYALGKRDTIAWIRMKGAGDIIDVWKKKLNQDPLEIVKKSVDTWKKKSNVMIK